MRRAQFLLAVVFCCAAFSQASKPDYSGTWKLNDGKSTHDRPPDQVFLMTVEQSKNTVTVTTKAEGVKNLLDGTFPITEKFHVEKAANGFRSTRAYWEGGTLVFEVTDRDSKKDTALVLFYVRESWILSPDGKVLTKFRRTLEAPKVTGQKANITDQKYVLDKQ